MYRLSRLKYIFPIYFVCLFLDGALSRVGTIIFQLSYSMVSELVFYG